MDGGGGGIATPFYDSCPKLTNINFFLRMGIVLSDSKRILCNKRIICINTVITSDPTAQESSFYENLCSEVVPRCQVTICVDITFFHNANVFCYRFSLSAETLASSFRKVTNNDFYVFCEKNLFSLCV